MSNSFDFEQALKAIQSGKEGVLTPLIKQLTEAALKAEPEHHLETCDETNRKNSTTIKTAKSANGSFELDTQRDCSGSFSSPLVKKNQIRLTDEIGRKILSKFALAMSYKGMRQHVSEMYALDVSQATNSSVTDRLITELKE
ncbi:hypothetical protein EKG39_22940 [Shewanella atlantica]|uniref:Mutator family transposase n=1 Tax=Shewanella atlantica TaxID=271099 RepID=A0A3S0K9J9_9GAMM|nr:hypothetical protein EKG39_22940 [Shewanella atlantica]